MACYHPIDAWQGDGYRDVDGTYVKGIVSLKENGGKRIKLPCGKCIGCRVKHTMAWATRCMHEAQMHPVNSFVTLTYDDKHYKPSLEYRDFQLFMKRLRKVYPSKVRFFACGEYGEDKSRPHFHALLFGVGFPNNGMVGKSIYQSHVLNVLWPYGFSSIGEVNRTTARYVASYTIKKRTVATNPDYYKRVDLNTGEIIDVTPEFGRMSLRPGIGAPWFAKYWRDVYLARDGVVVDGKTIAPPRYYDKRLAATNPTLSVDKEYDRYIRRLEFDVDEETVDRLHIREQVAKASLQFNSRRSL